METQLTLFLALAFSVLLINTIFLWLLYRKASRSAERAARYQHHYSLLMQGLRVALERAEQASARATEWSGQIRNSVVRTTGNVDRADNWLRYGLAKLEFNVDRVSEEIRETASEIEAAISEPLYRTSAIVSGIKALLEFATLAHRHRRIRGSE